MDAPTAVCGSQGALTAACLCASHHIPLSKGTHQREALSVHPAGEGLNIVKNPVIIKIQLTASHISLLWKPVLILPVKKKKKKRLYNQKLPLTLLKLILIWMQGGRCGELSNFCFISHLNCSTSPVLDLQLDVLSSGTGIILTTTAHSYLIIFKHPGPFIDYRSHEWG